jgi:hypothetical protein
MRRLDARLRVLEQWAALSEQPPPGGGLAALLEWAKIHLPRRDPWELDDLVDDTSSYGFGPLLRQARQWQRAQEQERRWHGGARLGGPRDDV